MSAGAPPLAPPSLWATQMRLANEGRPAPSLAAAAAARELRRQELERETREQIDRLREDEEESEAERLERMLGRTEAAHRGLAAGEQQEEEEDSGDTPDTPAVRRHPPRLDMTSEEQDDGGERRLPSHFLEALRELRQKEEEEAASEGPLAPVIRRQGKAYSLNPALLESIESRGWRLGRLIGTGSNSHVWLAEREGTPSAVVVLQDGWMTRAPGDVRAREAVRIAHRHPQLFPHVYDCLYFSEPYSLDAGYVRSQQMNPDFKDRPVLFLERMHHVLHELLNGERDRPRRQSLCDQFGEWLVNAVRRLFTSEEVEYWDLHAGNFGVNRDGRLMFRFLDIDSLRYVKDTAKRLFEAIYRAQTFAEQLVEEYEQPVEFEKSSEGAAASRREASARLASPERPASMRAASARLASEKRASKPKIAKKKKENTKKRKTQDKKKAPSFGRYVLLVGKKLSIGSSISRKAMAVVQDLLSDTLGRMSDLGLALARKAGRRTLQARDMKAAVRLMLPPGELAKHALAEGASAVRTYRLRSFAPARGEDLG